MGNHGVLRNIHAPQSYETITELKMLSSTENLIISSQESKPNIAIVQDSLLAAYKMTKNIVKMTRDQFYNISLSGNRVDGSPLWDPKRIQTIRRVMKKFGKKVCSYTGHGLVSLILPYDFYYEKTNKANLNEPTVKIFQGVMYEGTLNKDILGASHNSLIQVLYKEYGSKTTSNFVDNIQFITNSWLLYFGFSVGLEDCMVASQESQETIQDVLTESYTKAQGIEETTHNLGIREVRVTAALSQAKDIGMKIAKDAMNSDNNFLDTVGSGSKGDFFNIAQLTAMLGQQNLFGQRVKPTLNSGRRTLPHYPIDGKMSREREYESRGFVCHSFIHGLSPQEFFFHAMSGREGICDTAMNTASSGYIQRRIVKVMEDMQIQYDGTVRDMSGVVCQFAYSENGWDSSKTVKVGNDQEICDISRMVQQLNFERELKQKSEKSSTIVKSPTKSPTKLKKTKSPTKLKKTKSPTKSPTRITDCQHEGYDISVMMDRLSIKPAKKKKRVKHKPKEDIDDLEQCLASLSI